jgi:hypothetical protein
MVKAKFPNLVALEDEEFARTYSQFKILKATAWAVGGCGLLLGGLGVANTMIMSVFTRIREIAILRVSGFSNLQIATMIFGESALVSILGAVVGLAIGTGFLFALKLISTLHGYIDVAVQPLILCTVILLALLTGVAGALYPAIYAMRSWRQGVRHVGHRETELTGIVAVHCHFDSRVKMRLNDGDIAKEIACKVRFRPLLDKRSPGRYRHLVHRSEWVWAIRSS